MMGFWGPTLFLAVYFTNILPLLPGAIGIIGGVGMVQPQEPFALMITRSRLPVFVNSKLFSSTASSLIVPKSRINLSNFIFAVLEAADFFDEVETDFDMTVALVPFVWATPSVDENKKMTIKQNKSVMNFIGKGFYMKNCVNVILFIK